MAKKKINVRKDYSYEAKKRLPAYARPKAQRQMYFLILRGPGLIQSEVMEENAAIKSFALAQHLKIKLLQAQTPEAAAAMIKQSFTYASGLVLNPGELVDSEKVMEEAIKKLRIPLKKLKAAKVSPELYVEAIKAIILMIQKKNEV